MLTKYIGHLNNFSDVIKIMPTLKTTKKKGDLFEEFTKYIFKYHPYYENEFDNIWLYDEIPGNIKQLLNLPPKDEGIDLVLYSKDKKYYAVQCKYRTNINNIISWNELGTFTGLTFGVADGFHKAFFVTNTLEITKNIVNSNKIISIYGTFFNDIPTIVFDKIKIFFGNNNIIIPKTLYPLQHQISAIDKSVEYFNESDRGYWEMSCGSGKTLTSMWLLERLHPITSIVVVPSLYLLSQIYNEYVQHITNLKKNFILVGSDCDVNDGEYHNGLLITTDVMEISDRVTFFENDVIIITTYQSSDKVINSLSLLGITPDICIFDEAHKTVGEIGKQFNLLLDDKNFKINKRLFMTATPKVYGGEKNDEIYSMNDEIWYGKNIYTYNTGNAIADDRLCDYQIISMLSNDNHIKQFVETNKYVKFNDNSNDSYYLASGIMLLNAFKDGECHHMITYHNTVANTKQFVKILQSLLGIYKQDINILQIDGNSTMKHKNQTVNCFVNSEKAILVSARVLNEGINIPIIDSICFVDNRTSTIDIIQCIGRALRLHPLKTAGKVFLPIFIENMDEYDDTKIFGNIIRVLKSLSTTDEHVIEYFRCEYTKAICGGKRGKLVVHKNYIENIHEGINIEEWIGGISMKLWGGFNNWSMMRELVFKYCIKKGKCPTKSTIYKNKNIGIWLKYNRNQINNVDDKLYIKLSTNSYVKQNLDEHIKYIQTIRLSSTEMKNLLFKYCTKYETIPPKDIKYKGQNIGIWLATQKENIKSNADVLYLELSTNDYVKDSLDKYLAYVEKKLTFDEWINLLFKYCEDNKMTPPTDIKIGCIKLGSWYRRQKKLIKNTKNPKYLILSNNNYVKKNLDDYLLKIGQCNNKIKFSMKEMSTLFFDYCHIFFTVPTKRTEYLEQKIGGWYNTRKRNIKSPNDELYKKLTKDNIYAKTALDEYLKSKGVLLLE
jgi:superfamily II DNA or RNA helicase